MLNSIRISVLARKAGVIGLAISAVAASTVVFEAAAAEDGNWVVASAEGEVSIKGQANDASVGPGAVIETGVDGKAILTRPGDSVTIFPNSRISVPVVANGGKTGFLQTLGRLLFRMESRESRDFEVTTPYLAAAIKGTTFTVEVGDDYSAVEVTEGSVLVTASRSGQSAYVGSGGRARVGRDGADYVKLSAVRDRSDENENKLETATVETVTETDAEADTSTGSKSSPGTGSTSGSSTNANPSGKKDSPSDGDSGNGNDPGNSGKPPGQQ